MTTDKAPSTLATVKHGGCVQLVDASHPWPEVDRVLTDAYVAGNEGDEFDMIAARNALYAALSAQPSPGGQGATFQWENFPAYLIDKCEGDTISEEGLQQALAAMAKDERYSIAARQPVCGTCDEAIQPDAMTGAKCACSRLPVASIQPSGKSGELAVDNKPVGCTECPVTRLPFYGNMEHPKLGWIAMYGGPLDVYSVPELQDNDGELRRERYDLDADCWVEGGEPLGYFYSEQQPDATQPAQAVDLGGIPEGWRLSKKATCYQLSRGNDIIGNLVGPGAEENAAIIARVLDSQAVGNG